MHEKAPVQIEQNLVGALGTTIGLATAQWKVGSIPTASTSL